MQGVWKEKMQGVEGGVGARVGGKGMIARGGARAFESKQGPEQGVAASRGECARGGSKQGRVQGAVGAMRPRDGRNGEPMGDRGGRALGVGRGGQGMIERKG